MGAPQTAYIGLGSNKGDRVRLIAEAVRKVKRLPLTRVLALSSLFETAPVQVRGGFFINAVMAVATEMDPRQLLESLMKTETEMGRKREGKGPAPRNIDLDLLLYGDLVVREKSLIVPHPGILDRRFVLEPLAEIAPDLRIPLPDGTFSEAVSTLKDRCREQQVFKIGSLDRKFSV